MERPPARCYGVETAMDNLFGTEAIAAGYAQCRPAVHPHIIERIGGRLPRRLNRPDHGRWVAQLRRPASLLSGSDARTCRYPPAQDGARDLTPASLAALPYGFWMNTHEEFEIGLTLAPDFYLDYVMTETNVAWAVKIGVAPGAIRSWCADSLRAVFNGAAREVLFRGYIAYMSLG